MLRPSYSELMSVINKENSVDNQITSRYTIVVATAKRARQLIDGAEALTRQNIDKPVSTAVKELRENKLKIISVESKEDRTCLTKLENSSEVNINSEEA